MGFLKNSLKGYNEILESIKEKESPIGIYGVTEGFTSTIAYSLKKDTNKNIIVITSDNLRSRKIYEDLQSYDEDANLFPKRDIFLYDSDVKSLENMNMRIETMKSILSKEKSITITTADSLLNRIVNVNIFKDHIINIKINESINLKEIENKLVEMGYERTTQVESFGQFSVRGFIVDIYSERPYRIELFDEDIDSIRSFDIATQRSNEKLDEINIYPVTDVLIVDEDRANIAEKLNKSIKKSKVKDSSRDRLEEKFFKYMDKLKNKDYISNTDLIIPFIGKENLSLILDYYSEKPIILIEEPNRCYERVKILETEFKENISDMISFGEALPEHANINVDFEDLIIRLKKDIMITLSSLPIRLKELNPRSIINLNMKSITNYRGRMKLFIEDLKTYIQKGYKVIIMAGNEKKAKRLVETLLEFKIASDLDDELDIDLKTSQVKIKARSINDGYEIIDSKVVIINHSEIYGDLKKKRKISKNKKITFQDLKVGDYVVHEAHGIGKYVGTKKLEVKGIYKDYIVIEYKGDDKLFIPIEFLDSIYKYVSTDGVTPKLNKLNSTEWAKTKSKAKKNIDDIAEDLIKLYAKRKELSGFAFSKDTTWQQEFEDSFEFEETSGQLQSIEEIKEDMEKDRPMDRLLCADVGYGKTEVALRAAFKAVMDSKQVAILVPTTILAQQHYNTIVERFKNYPVKIALLNRFRSAKEIKKDIKDINAGVIDIIVGTHRILSNDVVFKDLGLLIIDEEQRFGVRHKERLKMLKENVDTLTLTATPIPRTLQMSMIGIRDMSVIDEPPAERFPVQTYVLEYNPFMVREAIIKELERGGQVYFVYNKVESIEQKLLEIEKLVPEARIRIAHGQMSERLLEDTMIDFINKEFDVLLCSTIIETGMDVRNTNTMIVSDANKLGLSQLYQLRGRIGRSNRISYCYFTYEKNAALSEVAQKRLKAIKEFTEFGSGYKIALRDLEIRGSGSILGSRQHGHINSVGYDLYIKYLKQAISKLKGEESKENLEINIDLKLDSYIPKNYIKDEDTRIEIYKKIGNIENEEDYEDLLDEILDRFSDPPIEIINLLDISLIKSISIEAGIKSIIEKGEEFEVSLYELPNLEMINSIQDEFRNVTFDLGENPKIKISNLKNRVKDLKKIVKIIKLHKKFIPKYNK